MSANLRDFEITFVDGKCFNNVCFVRDICKHYHEDPTSEQKIQMMEVPCEKCNLFSDNRTVTIDTTTKYAEEF